jgi:flagellar basal body rod protein FlgC
MGMFDAINISASGAYRSELQNGCCCEDIANATTTRDSRRNTLSAQDDSSGRGQIDPLLSVLAERRGQAHSRRGVRVVDYSSRSVRVQAPV